MEDGVGPNTIRFGVSPQLPTVGRPPRIPGKVRRVSQLADGGYEVQEVDSDEDESPEVPSDEDSDGRTGGGAGAGAGRPRRRRRRGRSRASSVAQSVTSDINVPTAHNTANGRGGGGGAGGGGGLPKIPSSAQLEFQSHASGVPTRRRQNGKAGRRSHIGRGRPRRRKSKRAAQSTRQPWRSDAQPTPVKGAAALPPRKPAVPRQRRRRAKKKDSETAAQRVASLPFRLAGQPGRAAEQQRQDESAPGASGGVSPAEDGGGGGGGEGGAQQPQQQHGRARGRGHDREKGRGRRARRHSGAQHGKKEHSASNATADTQPAKGQQLLLPQVPSAQQTQQAQQAQQAQRALQAQQAQQKKQKQRAQKAKARTRSNGDSGSDKKPAARDRGGNGTKSGAGTGVEQSDYFLSLGASATGAMGTPRGRQSTSPVPHEREPYGAVSAGGATSPSGALARTKSHRSKSSRRMEPTYSFKSTSSSRREERRNRGSVDETIGRHGGFDPLPHDPPKKNVVPVYRKGADEQRKLREKYAVPDALSHHFALLCRVFTMCVVSGTPTV